MHAPMARRSMLRGRPSEPKPKQSIQSDGTSIYVLESVSITSSALVMFCAAHVTAFADKSAAREWLTLSTAIQGASSPADVDSKLLGSAMPSHNDAIAIDLSMIRSYLVTDRPHRGSSSTVA